MNTAHDDRITTGSAEAQVRRRLDEIWTTAAARDFAKLESFHLYGPLFTEFKEGRPRGDAASCAAGERAIFGQLDGASVDMRQLVVHVFGDVAIATFNGHFAGQMQEHPVALDQQGTLIFVRTGDDWKIVHEHFSPLGGSTGGPPGAGAPAGD